MADYTPNYGLHQWVPEDQFRRVDFNEDFAKLDTALRDLEDTKADSASVDSRFAAIDNSLSAMTAADATKADSTSVDNRFAAVNADIEELREVDAAKADSASVDSRFAAVNSDITALEGRVSVIVGKYTGNGAATRSISLGFTPKAVLLEHSSGLREFGSGIYVGGLALQGAASDAFQVITGGFSVKYTLGINHTNENGVVYRYLAFR